MFGLGVGELVVILFIVVLLFGGSKLPQLGGALGKAVNNFKQGLRDSSDHPNDIAGPTPTENNGHEKGTNV